MNWWLALIVILAGLSVVGDVFMKIAGAGTVRWGALTLGVLLYAGVSVGWFFVFKHVKLGTLGVYYSISTVLLLAIVGVVYFGERLSTSEAVGVGAAIVSLALLARFG